MLETLSQAIVSYFQTATGSEVTSLRTAVSSIWDTIAAPGTPYPTLIFEYFPSAFQDTFCSSVGTYPIDFTVYAQTKQQSLELGYLARKAFSNQTLALSGGTNLGAIYDGTSSSFDTLDQVHLTSVSINYVVEEPGVNIPPTTYETEIGAAVQTLSALWATDTFELEIPEASAYFADPPEPSPLGKLLTRPGKLTGVASNAGEALTFGTCFLYVKKNGTAVGTIEYIAGNTTPIISFTEETFVAGDYIQLDFEPLSDHEGLANIDVVLSIQYTG